MPRASWRRGCWAIGATAPSRLWNPIRYMVILSRGIFLQNLPWALARPQLWPMALIGCVTLGFATWLFSRRLE